MYTGAVTVFDREQGQNYALASKLAMGFLFWVFLCTFLVGFFQYTTAAL